MRNSSLTKARPILILDADGTLTDIRHHELIYARGFAKSFSWQTHTPLSTIEDLATHFRKEVLADPTSGWMMPHGIVAPAASDPYMITVTTFQKISSYLNIDPKKASAMQFKAHAAGYRDCESAIKPEARDILDAVVQKYFTCVVTNTSTNLIAQKLHDASIHNIPVYGDAKKFVINPTWNAVPRSMSIPGFPREILLQRKNYHDVVMSTTSSMKDVTVVGDNFEVDLAMPGYLGARIIQIDNGFKIPREVAFMNDGSSKKAYVSNLAEAARFLGCK